jgi:signal transduction histidine kinase
MHIRQLWTNLINNAIKYTDDGGEVTVRLFPESGGIVGEVKDTGIGIAEEELPHLFEEFYRTERAKAHAQHGTGLGLSIVKQVVEEYGGDIQVYSHLDEGTRFVFRLPVEGAITSAPQ